MLSNFHLCSVSDGQHVYRSAEHAYFAQLAANEIARAEIQACFTAAQAKATAKWHTQNDWKERHVACMLQALRWKFSQNENLKALLLATGDRPLVHYAPWGDTYWGVGSDPTKCLASAMLLR